MTALQPRRYLVVIGGFGWEYIPPHAVNCPPVRGAPATLDWRGSPTVGGFFLLGLPFYPSFAQHIIIYTYMDTGNSETRRTLLYCRKHIQI